jgi:hypothetical protein
MATRDNPPAGSDSHWLFPYLAATGGSTASKLSDYMRDVLPKPTDSRTSSKPAWPIVKGFPIDSPVGKALRSGCANKIVNSRHGSLYLSAMMAIACGNWAFSTHCNIFEYIMGLNVTMFSAACVLNGKCDVYCVLMSAPILTNDIPPQILIPKRTLPTCHCRSSEMSHAVVTKLFGVNSILGWLRK